MAKSKGRIRHFAISVPDPWAAAEFYKAAFGLEELGA
jgi:predicted enzyme related to lactoylglutathione lyase